MKLAAREGDPKGVEDQQKAFQLEMKKVLTQIPSEIEETLEEAEKAYRENGFQRSNCTA